MFIRSIQLLSVISLVFSLPPLVQAGPVTFHFGGEITRVLDLDNLLGGQIAVGSPFSGQYTFESDTPDSNPEPSRGEYLGAMLSVSGEVAGIPFSASNGGTSQISIRNGFGSSISDSYSYIVEVSFLGLRFDQSLVLSDNSGTVLDSDNLFTLAPDLSSFSFHLFSISDTTETIRLNLDGQLLSFVPEPGTLVLLLLGACGVIHRPTRLRPRARTMNMTNTLNTFSVYLATGVLMGTNGGIQLSR